VLSDLCREKTGWGNDAVVFPGVRKNASQKRKKKPSTSKESKISTDNLLEFLECEAYLPMVRVKNISLCEECIEKYLPHLK
jgi:hypothetical protein